MICRLNLVITLIVVGLLGAAVPAQGQTFKVGSFTKSTAGAPVTQAVTHNLGETPKALILWTAGKTGQSMTVNYYFSFGMTDGTTSYSAAAGSLNNANTSNASRRIAAKAITMVQWGEVAIAEADLQSWTTTSFTLNWTTNNGTAYVVHYLIIGGDVSAKVKNWQMANATGNQSITGIGFPPDVVIHAHCGYNYLNVGTNSTSSALGLGAMDRNGNQWATQILSMDATADSDTQRGQQTNAALFSFNNALTVQKKASYVSMDSDGFTVNYSTAVAANAGQMISLALSGVNSKVGNFLKSTGGAPASQSVTGVGFTPGALFLASFQDIAQANPVVHTRFGIGSGDGTTEGSSAVSDTNALGRTSVDAIDKTGKVFMKVNNDSRVIDAEADISSMGSDGFTLNWTTNDGVATQMLYLALGQLRSFGYMKGIAIDRTKVGVTGTATTTLSDFPLLVNCADADLKTTANGGHVTSSSGYDIVFRSRDDAVCGGAGTAPCQLDHEIEKYDGTTGLLTAWVRIPSLNTNASASDTVIWVYYGNADITSSLENENGVWDTNFKGVWHLGEDASGTGTAGLYADSTSNGNDGDDYVSSTGKEGQIGNGQNYNGTSDYISLPTGCFTTGATTVEFWLKPNSPPNYNAAFIQAATACASQQFRIFWHSGHLEVRQATTGAAGTPQAATAAVTNATWTHFAWIFDGTNHTLYVDGSVSSGAVAGTNVGVGGSNYIGKRDTTNFWTGNLDEVHVSNTNRSADWIKTEYNNQSSPCTFYTLGSEQASPATLARMVSFTATNYSGLVQLRWKTGYEVNNLGFRLYREQGGTGKRITPSMVAGSALFARRGTALTSGRSYTWNDRLKDETVPVRYWLEDVDLNGRSTWHGPVVPEFGGTLPAVQAQSEVLSHLGKRSSGTRIQAPVWGAASLGGAEEIGAAEAVSEGVQLTAPEPVQEAATGSLAVQWDLAAKGTIKILVKREGWYRLTQAELAQAGLNPGADTANLRLFADGVEQPMVVNAGTNRRLDAADWIEFYGTGLDTPWTDTRVYWLVADNRAGKRVPTVKVSGARTTAGSFQYTVERRDRTIHWTGLLNGDGENFFGSVVSSDPVEEILQLDHVDAMAPGNAQLEIGLQGATDGAHIVQVQVNGMNAGTVTFQGQALGVGMITLPHSMLKTGENEISLAAQNVEEDVSLVSTIRLTYWHTFEADDDALRLTLAGSQTVTVEGFSSPGIRVVDVTGPLSVQEVAGTVAPKGTGYAVTFGVPGSGIRRLLVFTEGRMQAAAGVSGNSPSSWNREVAGADVVIITHGDFMDALKPLQAQEQSEGYAVATVDVEDVYDEFSYGAKTPYAIRDLLLLARGQWKKKPRFLMLAGDASFDPRNYLEFGDFDYVPTRLVDTAYMEAASDDWFADFNNDAISDIAVGRLSVRTASEAAAQVGKIVAYKQAAKAGGIAESWARQVVLVADRNEGYDFEAASEGLRDQIPGTLTVAEIFRGRMDDGTARGLILASLNNGSLLMNYLGHGSVEVWRGDLLTSGDATALTNGTRLPFLVAMNCLNGAFNDVYSECLSEALMKAPNGGTVGVWASSALNEPEPQEVINEEFYRQIFKYGLTVGEAALKAKAAVKNTDVRRTWILFGDPTLRLRP